MESGLWTTRQLADYLGLSPATALRRWRAGEIPGIVLASNVVRFDPAEIGAWLASRRRRTDTGSRPFHPID
jgi:predicted DNA-binding transcriptional regulator AlpA